MLFALQFVSCVFILPFPFCRYICLLNDCCDTHCFMISQKACRGFSFLHCFFCVLKHSLLLSRDFFVCCCVAIFEPQYNLFSLDNFTCFHCYGAPCVKLRNIKFCIIFLVKLHAISYIVAMYLYCCNMC